MTEVSQRPHSRFVPIKTEHQQDVNYLLRIRERIIKSKTALGNQFRGLLSEFGVVFPRGHAAVLNGMTQSPQRQG
jgi:transposase